MNKQNTTLLVALISAISASPVYAQKAALNVGMMSTGYQVSKPYSSGNLSLFLIKGPDKSKNMKYLTLPEAIAKKQIVVRETGDVNLLKIDNLSDSTIFIQSGEIVKGGQQDRALKSDMLIRPRSQNIDLPCFCVEHGRWSGRVGESASQFNSANNFIVGNGMHLAIKKDGDQTKVWQQVEAKQAQLSRTLTKSVASTVSPSSLQLTLEEKSVKEATEMQFKALCDAVEQEKDAVGYAVAINGKINNADVYASGGLFKKLWPGLLKSAVIEAVAQRGHSQKKLPTGAEVKNVLAGAEHFSASPRDYGVAPSLQGATNGTIYEQGQDATFVTGVNTAGTVRVVNPSPLDYFFKTTDSKSGAVIHENFIGK